MPARRHGDGLRNRRRFRVTGGLHWLWLAVPLLAVAPMFVNAAIRRGLAPPRVLEGETPGAFGLAWQAVRVPTANGRSLGGWLIPAGSGAPALIVMHGWGGNAEMMLPAALPLHRAGFALLLVDARNHGMSDSDSFSSLPRFAEDIEHAFQWLCGRPEADSRRIAVLGHSVGAGAALLAASRRPELAAVVSVAAFAHPETMMRSWLAARGVPYWPLGWYVLSYVQRVIGYRFADIAPCRTIADVACPVLLVHGSDDATVPVSDAERIRAGALRGRAELLIVPGGHDDYQEAAGRIAEVVAFLRQALSCETRGGSPPASNRELS